MRLHRFIVPAAAAALLATAPAALADTRVSIANGEFASGQDGKHVLIRDINSITHNEPLDVTATRNATTLSVRDDAGELVADAPCDEVGAEVRCPLSGVLGLRFEGSQLSDVLTNDTDLLAAYRGDDGNDEMFGGSARDEMVGDLGNDLMDGHAGNDVFVASKLTDDGADDMVGGDGSDTADYRASQDAVTVNLSTNGGDEDGDDVRTENLLGSQFADTLTGSAASNLINGFGANDAIDAREGDDRLVGGTGPDGLVGGPGVDSAEYQERTAGVKVTIDDVSDDGNADDANDDNVTTSVEIVRGGSGPDELTGPLQGSAAGAANTLIGNGGADELDGGPGDDLLNGGDDHDSFDPGDGNDRLLGGGGPDAMFGGAGNDRLEGGDGDDSLQANDGDNALDGGPGKDLLKSGTGNDQLSGGPGDDGLDGGTGRDTVSGDDGIDGTNYVFRSEDVTITLDSGVADDGGPSDGVAGQRDTVTTVEQATGGNGNDLIVGDGDAETLRGQSGNDVLRGNGGADTLEGGVLDDTIVGGLGDDRIVGDVDPENLNGGGNDVLSGNDGADTIVGGKLNDTISGGPGPDTLRGGSGDDNIDGDADNDSVHGDADDDLLIGGTGVDEVLGADGDDALRVNDGVRDEPLACGLGTDSLDADLQDILTDTVLDCEDIQVAPVNELPTVEILGSTLKIDRAGRARLRLHCPEAVTARRCAGRLSLVAGRAGKNRLTARAALARKGYRIRRGKTAKVRLPLSRREVRLLKQRKLAVAIATQRASQGRTKTTAKVLAVR